MHGLILLKDKKNKYWAMHYININKMNINELELLLIIYKLYKI